MSRAVAVPWDPALVEYDFGASHPLNPVRVELTFALARALGVMDRPNITELGVTPADDALLTLVHAPSYLDAVKEAGSTGRPDPLHGLGTMDNPVFADMHEASALVAGGTLAAARAVLEQTHDHAVNIAGGLHHAMPAAASGFCVYNDPAIAIAWLLEQGVEKIAYVDIDAHHGDGVQAAFWDDPRVLTISLHESGRTLFPGTGFPDEIGGVGAEGTAVNVALPAGCAPFMRWCRRSCAPSPQRSSSRSMVATATRSTRSPTCWSPWTVSAPRTQRYTASRTKSVTAAGSRPAAAGTSWSVSCPGHGRICWRRPGVRRSSRRRIHRRSGESSCSNAHRRTVHCE